MKTEDTDALKAKVEAAMRERDRLTTEVKALKAEQRRLELALRAARRRGEAE